MDKVNDEQTVPQTLTRQMLCAYCVAHGIDDRSINLDAISDHHRLKPSRMHEGVAGHALHELQVAHHQRIIIL